MRRPLGIEGDNVNEGRDDEDGRKGMGLTGKRTAWDSVNGSGRWEGL